MEKQKMIIWSPSSWALWKQCPAKYRIKHLERWSYPKAQEDSNLIRLAIPGLVVDKLFQLWLHRADFSDFLWLDHNFDMVWSMTTSEVELKWSQSENESIRNETQLGMKHAFTLLQALPLVNRTLITQASYFEQIDGQYSITGAADLLLIDRKTNSGTLIDFKNSHNRQRLTKDQLVIYQMGLEIKYQIKIHQAGYLMFNPRINDWKWFNLKNPAHKDKMKEKLSTATNLVVEKRFDFDWNKYSCVRFCEVRFSCEIFQRVAGLSDTNTPRI